MQISVNKLKSCHTNDEPEVLQYIDKNSLVVSKVVILYATKKTKFVIILLIIHISF